MIIGVRFFILLAVFFSTKTVIMILNLNVKLLYGENSTQWKSIIIFNHDTKPIRHYQSFIALTRRCWTIRLCSSQSLLPLHITAKYCGLFCVWLRIFFVLVWVHEFIVIITLLNLIKIVKWCFCIVIPLILTIN
jgi:hypothetical protein